MKIGKRSSILWEFCFLFFGVLVIRGVSAAHFYLDKGAEGSNNGTLWENAWTSVSSVRWDAIGPGDTLWIQGGVYDEHLHISGRPNIAVRIATNATEQAVFRSGSVWQADHLVIDGLLNGAPHIQFTGTHPQGANGFWVRNSKHLVFRGIEVNREGVWMEDTVQTHGIRISGPVDRVLIEFCHVYNTSGDGINIAPNPVEWRNAYDSFVVTNCVISNVGDDGIQAAADQITVAGCYVNKNTFETLFYGHPDGFQLNPGHRNVKMFNNTFKNFNMNIFIERALGNIFIYNNVMTSDNTSGADRGSNISINTNTWDGVFVMANNVYYNFRSYSANNGGSTLEGMPGIYIGNNVFLNCRNISLSSHDELFDESNIYWHEPSVQYYNSDGNPVAFPGNRGAGNSRFVNPLFADPNAFDFRLLSGSPAIASGINLSQLFDTDRDGNLRGDVWHIGAYGLYELSGEPQPELAPLPAAPRGLRPRALDE